MKKIVSSLFLCFTISVIAQKGDFKWPLADPIVLSGNYGELRPNHFHAGLDFSTKNAINLPVYAAKDGYVSRIKVSSMGYGKCVYITHANGKVTVYGHLTNYEPALNKYVKSEQKKAKQYEVELFPKPGEIKYKGGDIIGYSGNSGNSTGPHLHFEIRDEKTEVPLNPALFYNIEDNQAPTLTHLGLYNLADTTNPRFLNFYPVITKDGKMKLKKDTLVLKSNIIGVAFSGQDKFTATGSTNNIYEVQIKFDEKPFYKHQLDNIPFDDAKYVSQFSQMQEKWRFQKCFQSTIFPRGMYKGVANKGRIMIGDTNVHKIRMIFKDEKGNQSELEFCVKAKEIRYFEPPTIQGDIFANANEDVLFGRKKLQIFIPAYTLYNSGAVIFENTLEASGKLMILPFDATLRSTAIVGFEVPKKFKKFKDKLVFKNVDNTYTPIVKNDSVFYSVRNFGGFVLIVDSLAPKIKTELPAAKLKTAKGLNKLVFVISEELSGIKDYKLTINGEWALAEFDAKSGRLTYFIEEDTPKGELNLVVEAMDKCKNKASFGLKVGN
ncbi:MAG: M23 family metallopeptidase [Sphingobacteriaceae bacterium]|nr:M23 family metallopeptidase [Sphingobacteriaceae bacterium]